MADVEERVSGEYDPQDAAEGQEHPQGAAPGVRYEAVLSSPGYLPTQLNRRGRPARRARVRVGRAHEPAVTVDADDRAGQRVQFLPLAHFLATGDG